MVRGIPSGYLSSLEKRLAETQVALYGAVRGVDCTKLHDYVGVVEKYDAGQTRAAKQAAWTSTPLTKSGDLAQWTDRMDHLLSANRQLDGPITQAAIGVDTNDIERLPALLVSTPALDDPSPCPGADTNISKTKDDRTSAPHTYGEITLSPPAKRARKGDEIDEAARSELGVMRRSRTNNAASFVGSASGIQFVRAVYNAMANATQKHAEDTHVTDGVPAEDDQLSGPDVSGLWHKHEVLPDSPALGSNVPHVSKGELLAWSQSYFDIWHPAYPFLEMSDVQECFDRIASGVTLSEDERDARYRDTLVRSIMSIALADRRQSGSQESVGQVPSSLLHRSFGAALESVQSALVEPPSLKLLQAVLSVQLFLITMLRHNAASRLGGLANRMIFQMGLHRCPSRYTTFSTAEVSLRRRIFYAAYCIDRHICQSLGLPLTLRDDDIDVCRPGHEVHSTDKIGKSVEQHHSSLSDFLARHGEIAGLIMELRNKSINHRQTDRMLATLLSAKISKWGNDVDGFLESDEAASLCDFHRVVLRVLNSESVIALNRPLLSSKVKPDHGSALHLCIGASRIIISTLHKHLQNRGTVPLAWPSFTWCVWMSALIALYAALDEEMQRPVAKRLADQAAEILRHFAARGSIWPNACAAAIRDLSTRLSMSSDARNSAAYEQGLNLPDVGCDADLQSMFNEPIPMAGTVAAIHTFDDFSSNLFDGYEIPYWMGEPWLTEWTEPSLL